MRNYSLAIFFMGLALLLDIGVMGVLAIDGREINDIFKLIATGASSGLLGLLIPTPAAPPNP
jgi:hypothetical protein